MRTGTWLKAVVHVTGSEQLKRASKSSWRNLHGSAITCLKSKCLNVCICACTCISVQDRHDIIKRVIIPSGECYQIPHLSHRRQVEFWLVKVSEWMNEFKKEYKVDTSVLVCKDQQIAEIACLFGAAILRAFGPIKQLWIFINDLAKKS